MFHCNDEMLKILGLGKVQFREEHNGQKEVFVPTARISDDDRETIKAALHDNREGYIALGRFLSTAEESLWRDTIHWFETPAISVTEGDTQVILKDEVFKEDFELDWESQTAESVYGGSDTEMRRIHGPKQSRITVLYPFDETLDRDRRESTSVTFWLLDYNGRRVFHRVMEMTDAYIVRGNLMEALRAFDGNLDDVVEWCRAMKVYNDEFQRTHRFNPLTGH